MIRLTRLDGKEFILNSDLIEFIESMPDTVITLRTEKKILVKEPLQEVLNRVLSFKRSVFSEPFYEEGDRTYIKSENSGTFYSDYDLKKLRNFRDMEFIEEDSEEDEED